MFNKLHQKKTKKIFKKKHVKGTKVFLEKKKEKRRKKARDRQQFFCRRRRKKVSVSLDPNKNLSEQEKQKKVLLFSA